MSNPLRIAVADDAEEILIIIGRILRRLGHKVFVANDGNELVEICRYEEIDLIISDIKMPQLGGIEAVKQIAPEVPVVFMTADCEADFIEPAKSAGSYQILYKPVTAKTIESAIAMAMHHQQTTDSLQKQIEQLENTVRDRKTIERAKGLLMAEMNISEADAMRTLQKQARNAQSKLVVVADTIVSTFHNSPVNNG